jgi:hypothetical protein
VAWCYNNCFLKRRSAEIAIRLLFRTNATSRRSWIQPNLYRYDVTTAVDSPEKCVKWVKTATWKLSKNKNSTRTRLSLFQTSRQIRSAPSFLFFFFFSSFFFFFFSTQQWLDTEQLLIAASKSVKWPICQTGQPREFPRVLYFLAVWTGWEEYASETRLDQLASFLFFLS